MVISKANRRDAIAPAPARLGSPKWRAKIVKNAVAQPPATSNVPRIVLRQRERKDEARFSRRPRRAVAILGGSEWCEGCSGSSFILHLPASSSLQRHADGFEDFVQHSFSFFAAPHRRGITGTYGKPVGEDGNDETLYVIGNAIVTLFGQRKRLGRAKQRQRSARANAEVQHL